MEALAAASIAGMGALLRLPTTIAQSQAHTSAMFAAEATNSTTVSMSWTRPQEVWRIVRMAGNIRRF